MKKTINKPPPQSAPGDSMLKCRINGREASFPKGTILIQAFKKLGMEIAHYCWHPGLSAAGACRLCMVEIEGQQKLQIACNTEIQEGMAVSSQSEKVREAVKWGLEYHLINHPLDCPICDQAGECALQDQYMRFGAYSPSMSQSKVKKRKAVNLGPKIVLDTERCILCSRCVRFTDEVSKTHELGIFDRGDRSEIGVFKDRPLDNSYSLNTVDICPVGALTSKDFRFKQRVWNMKTADSVCSGCATGCAIHVDYNEEGIWRVRPRFNPEVNGHWMCDKGRALFKGANPAGRLRLAMRGQGLGWETLRPLEALKGIGLEMFWSGSQAVRRDGGQASKKAGPGRQREDQNGRESQNGAAHHAEAGQQKPPAVVLTGQYTNEEYQELAAAFPGSLFYHWTNWRREGEDKDFDGLLLRGDRNPNTAGLKKRFPKIKPWKEFEDLEPDERPLLTLGPENQAFYPDLEEKTKAFSKWGRFIWMAPGENPFLPPKKGFWQIPVRTSFEKNGSYISAGGISQKIRAVQIFAPQALPLQSCLKAFKEGEKAFEAGLQGAGTRPYFKSNQFLSRTEKLW